MKYVWILSLIVSVGIAGQGFNMPSFSFFDANGDGKISEKELNDGREVRRAQRVKEGKMLRNAKTAPSFSQIDTNRDGYISKEEFKAHQDARMQNL